MKITLKLFASLTDYLPPAVKYTNMLDMEVEPSASISQIRFNEGDFIRSLRRVGVHRIT